MNKEILGIIATLFVLISFLMSGEIKIRAFNVVGSIIFVVYGIMIGSLSVWFLNGVLFIVNIYKIIKLKRGGYTNEAFNQNTKVSRDGVEGGKGSI